MNGMVWVRILVGAVWLNGSLEKLLNPAFPHQFAASLQAGGYISQAPSWFQELMRSIVQPNAGLFAYLIQFGELALGLALILGLLTNLATITSILLSLAILVSQGGVQLGTGLGSPEFFTINMIIALLSLILLLAAGAKAASLDSLLVKHSPRLTPLLIGRRRPPA